MAYSKGQDAVSFPPGIAISNGLYSDLESVHKFGYNDAVGTSFETIWAIGGPLNAFGALGAETISVTSSDTANDNGETVEVVGLDANYEEATETVTIGAGATTSTWRWINTMRMTSTGNTTTHFSNAGDISATGSTSSAVGAKILANYGRTLQCVYRVPKGKRAHVMSVQGGSEKEKECLFRLMDFSGGVVNVRDIFSSYAAPVTKHFEFGSLIFDQFDIINLQAKANATTGVYGSMEIILEKR
tara:strand:+ start:158 stop:889 length:732 start_codon:yes stop_codon:yes gene_type:complete